MAFNHIATLFPCLKPTRTYLDSAATAHKPRLVLDTLSTFYAQRYAAVHRGLYVEAEAATLEFERAREQIAQFVKASPDEIIFTSGTTAALNFVADAWGMHNVKQGDQILVTEAEHHSNLLPWQRLARRVGAELRFIPIDPVTLQLKFDASLVTPLTKLVAVTQYSNVLGPIWSAGVLDRFITAAHQVGARVLIDGAQSVAHQATDLSSLGADFFAFSGHKLGGPTGIGVLYIRRNAQPEVDPYYVGGGMVDRVTLQDATFALAPHRFEAGTPPIAEVIGIGAAIQFFNDYIDFDELHRHELELSHELISILQRQPTIRVFSPACRQPHLATSVISFDTSGSVDDGIICTITNSHTNGKDACNYTVPDNGSRGIAPGHDMAARLGEEGILVRVGHHCAQPLHTRLGIDQTVRASLFCYNTMDDIKKFGEALVRVQKFFGVV